MRKEKHSKYVSEAIFGKIDRCSKAYEDYIRRYSKTIKNSRVLDVGCGLGNYTSLFSESKNEVFGLDVGDFRLPKFSDSFEFVKYDGEKMPFPDKHFDVIVSFDVIEHVKNDLQFVKEIKRIIKPKGKILIATPNRTRLAAFLLGLIRKKYVFPFVGQKTGFCGKSVHFREYTARELKSLFAKAGFDKVDIKCFWFGIRGKTDIGIKHVPIKSLCQYLFLSNK